MGLFDDDENCIGMTMSNSIIGGIGGSVVGFVKASYYMGPKVPRVPLNTPITTNQAARLMGNMGVQYAVLSALFTGGMCTLKGIRHQDDAYNYMGGGFLAGAAIGLKKKSFHSVVFTGAMMAILAAGAFHFGDGVKSDFKRNHVATEVLEKNVGWYKKASHAEHKKEQGTFY